MTKQVKKETKPKVKKEVKEKTKTVSEKTTELEIKEKTKQEKVLVAISWILFCVVGVFSILCSLFFLCLLLLPETFVQIVDLDLDLVLYLDRATEIFMDSYYLVAIPLLVTVLLSLLFAVVSKKKENPKIRSKYWRSTFRLMLATLFLFTLFYGFISYVVEEEDYTSERSVVVEKPIIYLYPTTETGVSVKVGKVQNLTHTYPKYEDGWYVTAQPDGDLKDASGRSYYALYWEGVHSGQSNLTDGFIVKGTDTISFLEEKLALLGLTEREANEFIVYWLPQLESNEYNFIRFETKAEVDDNMPLYVTPAPDTVIRVMMEYRSADKTEQVKPQQLPPTPKREGFVVVEWGGTQLK